MKRLSYSALAAVLLIAGTMGFAQKQVVVGSKIDTEGALLGKMIVKLLAADGIPVVDKVGFGTTGVVAAREAGASVHFKGTYISMEGPAFSTSAESRLYKSWGADVIGMTIFPEAKLAREAEICYASICCVTDYDSWREKEEGVTADVIISCLRKNVEISKKIIKLAVGKVPAKRTCECAGALKSAIVTAPTVMTLEQKRKFDLLIGKYIEKK